MRRPGDYSRDPSGLTVYLRACRYPGLASAPSRVRILLAGDRVTRVLRPGPGSDPAVAVEPELIATLYDSGFEDREVVRLDECPPVLMDAVLSVEDRRFYSTAVWT